MFLQIQEPTEVPGVAPDVVVSPGALIIVAVIVIVVIYYFMRKRKIEANLPDGQWLESE